MPNQYTNYPPPAPIYVIGPSIAYIPLGKSGKYACVDWENADRLARRRWRQQCGTAYTFYAACYHRNPDGTNRLFARMHNLVLPAKVGMDVDHVNRNGLDNRLGNLRYATRSQNCMNRTVRATSKSGRTGVSWSNTFDRWRATIRVNNHLTWLGSFVLLDEAIAARESAERKFFGEFAPK